MVSKEERAKCQQHGNAAAFGSALRRFGWIHTDVLTPLELAEHEGQAAVVKLLQRATHSRALWCGAQSTHAQARIVCCCAMAPLDNDIPEVISLACTGGDLPAVKAALQDGAEVALRNPHGQAALHLAAAGGERENPETVRWLLVEASADMDSTDAAGATALHLAVLNSHEGTTRVLLTHGADRLRPDSAGRTPLDIAATISSRAQGTLGTAPSTLLRMMREADPSPGLVLALYSERDRGRVAASLAAQAREHGLRDRAMALGTRLRVQDRDGAKPDRIRI